MNPGFLLDAHVTSLMGILHMNGLDYEHRLPGDRRQGGIRQDAHARHPQKFFISATAINLKMKNLRVTRLTGIPLSPAWLWPRKTQRARETIMVASG